MTKRWLLPAALVLGVIALVLALRSADDGSDWSATGPGDSSLAVRWQEGSAHQYKVTSSSDMRMTSGATGPSSIDVELVCLLDFLTLEVTRGEATVGMQLSAVDLAINGESDAGINRALSAPFRVRFAANGMPLAFEFPAVVGVQERTMLESLVRIFQVSLEPSDAWRAQESNANGTYEAVYTRSGPMQVEKAKRNLSVPPESMLTGAELASTEILRVDPAYDWLYSMRVEETMSTAGAGGPAIEVSNTATLERLPGVRTAATAATWLFDAEDASIDSSTEDLLSSVPNISPEEARRRIQATVPKLDAATQWRLMLVHDLRDLLQVDDSVPPVLLDILQTQQLNDRTRADLYLAFEGAGTASAQAALVSIVNDTANWSLRDNMRAIVALAGVDEPTNESIDSLWNTAQGAVFDTDSQRVASAATFALGSLGNSMREANDPEYQVLRSDLLSNALISGNEKKQSDFLIALGNTQDSTLVPEVAALLEDDAVMIRRATARSLGALGVDEAADKLVSTYEQEGNGSVRSAIVESLAAWSEPTDSAMATFRKSLETEKDESLRYNLCVLLGNHLDEFPENEDLLRDLMRRESSDRIRQKVASMLSAPD
jgi:HEAT repeat protein